VRATEVVGAIAKKITESTSTKNQSFLDANFKVALNAQAMRPLMGITASAHPGGR
jgi:hypothetical protein